GDRGRGTAAALRAARRARTVSPDGSDEDGGRAALGQRLEHRQRRQVVGPVGGREVGGQADQRGGKRNEGLGDAEPETGGDAKDKSVDSLRKVTSVGKEESG